MVIATILGFTKSSEVCKKKFNTLFKHYKCNKMIDEVFGKSKHECKFYDSIDQWWHQTITIMKHDTTSANDSFDQPPTPSTQEENIDFWDNEPTLEPTSESALKSSKCHSIIKPYVCFSIWLKTIV